MEAKDLIIGALKRGGYLRTKSEEILLTKIPMQAAESPELATLEVAPEDVGKMALVRGHLSGNVLYSAHIIEILSSVTTILFNMLLNKGVVTLEEFQNQLSELESNEGEAREKKKLCALVIGHKKYSHGAVNARANLSEFDFNEDLARHIEGKVQGTDIQRIYRRTYKELPGDINALGPDFIVSLHCNAFNGKVSGTEVLYYHRSEKGKRMAEILLNHLVKHLKLPNRGIKPMTSEDGGGYLLRYTDAPCVIAEPFFIDNDKDLARAQEDMDGLVAVYAAAIDHISQNVV
jgi:N-acetylmuramoyl-L-alanine amidase